MVKNWVMTHSLNHLNEFLSWVEHISLKIRRSKNNYLASKFNKTIKISKTKFVVKPSLLN